MTQYSYLKGFGKGLVGASIAGFSIVAFVLMTAQPDLYNTSVVDVVANSLRQILGSMTVGGLITFVINYLKINYSN